MSEEPLARWRVDPAAWRQFVARNEELDRAPDALWNELSIPDAIPDNGVEIVVARETVTVGDAVHDVPVRGTPEVTEAKLVQDGPDYIELQLLYPGYGGGASGALHPPKRTSLRFPVPAKAWHDARAVVAHFNRLTQQQADFFHGKGDGSDPEDLNTCIACGFQMHKFTSRCPRCGGGMLTRRWGRRFGGVLAVCGAIVAAIIGTVIYYTAPLMLHPGRSVDGTRFTGSAPTGLAIMGLFAIVLAFGLTALGYGIWQVRTGKRDKRVVYAMLTLFTVLLAIAYVL